MLLRKVVKLPVNNRVPDTVKPEKKEEEQIVEIQKEIIEEKSKTEEVVGTTDIQKKNKKNRKTNTQE